MWPQQVACDKLKSQLVNSLLERADVTKTNDVIKELSIPRFSRGHKDLQEINKSISETLNLF